MKRMTTTFIGAVMALTFIAASAATPAQAGSKERRIVAGILLGAIGGAIIANEINRSKKKKQHYNHRQNPSIMPHQSQRRNCFLFLILFFIWRTPK